MPSLAPPFQCPCLLEGRWGQLRFAANWWQREEVEQGGSQSRAGKLAHFTDAPPSPFSFIYQPVCPQFRLSPPVSAPSPLHVPPLSLFLTGEPSFPASAPCPAPLSLHVLYFPPVWPRFRPNSPVSALPPSSTPLPFPRFPILLPHPPWEHQSSAEVGLVLGLARCVSHQDRLFNDTSDYDLVPYMAVLKRTMPPPSGQWWLHKKNWYRMSWVASGEPGFGKGPPIGDNPE